MSRRDRKKATLRGAELATQQSQELAGKNPPSLTRGPPSKKELAKRSLRLMWREKTRTESESPEGSGSLPASFRRLAPFEV